ncbi:MAG: DUF5615 family PIN-like protein [Magnetococcales bacterium]|nr:DUF5615 family PIN-like protein [Magnetococcales bacterium]
MRYLIDAQLPPALARWLSAMEHQEAEHVFDVGLADAEDAVIWSHALRTGTVIVTKDDDFVKRSHLTHDGPPNVWIRGGNTSRQSLLIWFGNMLPAMEKALAAGEKVVEII